MFTLAFWKEWHRWIGFPAPLFLLHASLAGLTLACTEFFGAEEALRDATRDLVSPVSLASPSSEWAAPIGRAIDTAAATAGAEPIDRIRVTAACWWPCCGRPRSSPSRCRAS